MAEASNTHNFQLDALMKHLRDNDLRAAIQSKCESSDHTSVVSDIASYSGLTSPEQFGSDLQRVVENLKSTSTYKVACKEVTDRYPELATSISEANATTTNLPTLLSILQSDKDLLPLLQEIDQLGALAFVTFWQQPEAGGKSPEISAAEVSAASNADSDDDEQELNLHSAVMDGDRQLVHDLLLEGSDVNELDEQGRTALHSASALGEHSCMLNMLSAGADVNALDNTHNTPLHYAAGYGEFDSVLILLKNGADPTLRNSDGHTALQLAKMNEQDQVIEVLEKSLVRE